MIGFVCNLILFALSLLLFISVIGIPLALVMWFVLLLAFIMGLTGASVLVGEQIKGIPKKPGWLSTAAGSFLVIAGINFPFFGRLIGLVGKIKTEKD